LLVALPSARADFRIYYLNDPNDAVAPFQGPYGSVKVDLTDSTHATITLTALNNGGEFYLFGGQDMLGLNVNGTLSAGSLISWSRPDGSTDHAPTILINQSQNEDGFGSFIGAAVSAFDGAGSALNSVAFSITKQSGSWATVDAVLTPNSDSNHLTAGHVYVYDTSSYGTARATGYAADGDGPVAAPAPSSFALLVMAAPSLCGLLAVRRLRRPKPALAG
jgi:hypothetical protein